MGPLIFVANVWVSFDTFWCPMKPIYFPCLQTGDHYLIMLLAHLPRCLPCPRRATHQTVLRQRLHCFLHPNYLASSSPESAPEAIMHKKFGQSEERRSVGRPAPLIDSDETSSSGPRPAAISNNNSNASYILGSGNTIINNNPVIVYGDIPKESVRLRYDLPSALTGISGRHTSQDNQQ